MPRRKMRTYNQMVEPNEQYEDEHTIPGEAMPVVQRRGMPPVFGWLLVVAIIAIVAVAIVNRGTLAAPNIMEYSEDKDPYQTDEVVLRQRRLYHVKAAMNCDDVELTPLGTVGGLWSAECIQERQ